MHQTHIVFYLREINQAQRIGLIRSSVQGHSIDTVLPIVGCCPGILSMSARSRAYILYQMLVILGQAKLISHLHVYLTNIIYI